MGLVELTGSLRMRASGRDQGTRTGMMMQR